MNTKKNFLGVPSSPYPNPDPIPSPILGLDPNPQLHRKPKPQSYPVVIINWVQYLGPPGPFSFPDSRDLLEALGGFPWQRERALGRIPGTSAGGVLEPS